MHERFDRHFIMHNFFDYWICGLETSKNEIAQSHFNLCMKMKLKVQSNTLLFLI